MREHGFKEDSSEDATICRWLGGDVILDVMPTSEEILGFGNTWYQKAIEHDISIQLPDARNIRMVSPAYFLITKLEVFRGRGNGEYTLSHDIEDIVAVLDGRPEILDEIEIADTALVRELANRFRELLKDRKFRDAISGHMPTDSTSQARFSRIIGAINRISEL